MDEEEYFDVVVSLHTLEHVPDDRLMLRSLYNNLRKEGKLILEVPLLRKRPLGVPINPYHYREYHKEDIVDMIEDVGFEVFKLIGSSRSFYSLDISQARDAIQIHAIRRHG